MQPSRDPCDEAGTDGQYFLCREWEGEFLPDS